MAKVPKKAYVCNDCGAEFSRWQGQCSACKAWNTISEVRMVSVQQPSKGDRFSGYAGETRAKIQTLSEISLQEMPRFSSRRSSWGREIYFIITGNVRIGTKYDRTLCDR